MRTGAGVFAFWTFVVLAVLLVGEAALRGRFDVVADVAPWVALVLWGLWVLAYRPLISYDDSGVRVVNIFRTVTMPWSRVREITDRLQISFVLHDGRTIRCWGGPMKARPPRKSRFARSSGIPDTPPPTPLEQLERVWEPGRFSKDPAPVTQTWDLVPIISGAVILLWVAFTLLLK